LLTELLLLPVPVVLALNMMDFAEAQGTHVKAHVLEAAQIAQKILDVLERAGYPQFSRAWLFYPLSALPSACGVSVP
jgi:Ferrous iron transport protein B